MKAIELIQEGARWNGKFYGKNNTIYLNNKSYEIEDKEAFLSALGELGLSKSGKKSLSWEEEIEALLSDSAKQILYTNVGHKNGFNRLVATRMGVNSKNYTLMVQSAPEDVAEVAERCTVEIYKTVFKGIEIEAYFVFLDEKIIAGEMYRNGKETTGVSAEVLYNALKKENINFTKKYGK